VWIVRRLTKLLLYILAVFGPLTPAMGLFILVAPPLILLSGWPAPVQAVLLLIDVVMVLVAAVILGPSAIEEVREALREEARR
jgi:hypothetical protein